MLSSSSRYDDGTVTINRAYFDTLLRRTSQNGNPPLDLNGGGSSSVVIPQVEYNKLKYIAEQYANLKRNLIRGGINDETVELLSRSDEDIHAEAQDAAASRAGKTEDGGATEDGGVSLNSVYPTSSERPWGQANIGQHWRENTHDHSYSNGHNPNNGYNYGYDLTNNNSHTHNPSSRQPRGFYRYNPNSNSNGFDWTGNEEVDEEGEEEEGYDDKGVLQRNGTVPGADYAEPDGHQQIEREGHRSVQIVNLPEGTTYADVVNAIRGGQVLDVFLRSKERCASVAFVHPAHARNFMDHARRNDLYINNKRVNVRWNERQFVINKHTAKKLAMGATRNLSLAEWDRRHTEEVIRDDLDHICNLSVVKITYDGRICHISLNSVQSALWARSCMMSRLRYKGRTIQFDADECAQPYPIPAATKKKETFQPRKASNAGANRYQLLHDCGDEEAEEEEEDDVKTVFQSKK
ncbi:hypothetical protein QBC35DRAFT_445930 [Podospora australis]|uniref:RRM domain-containing protein n=1 Tax=Podospora australis TaxID=1536484 RepID=A0AAN6X4A6_9PEZI|nr:hypothetical protein QBC35DRAFT_445930 [Podospora australis]